MIVDAVYNEFQISMKYQEKRKGNPSSEVHTEDGKDVEAHVTQWQEQEFTEITKKSCAKFMAEKDHNFRHGADRARVQKYSHHQYLGWQDVIQGLRR
jgi:hypothetical protein